MLVTTCAWGTGMDPPCEVTFTVHVRMPPSLLDGWQEMSRSGRGGAHGACSASMGATRIAESGLDVVC